MTARTTLGGRLARSIAVVTAACLVVLCAVAATVWWIVESDEKPAEIIAEGPTGELTEAMLVALAIAVPLAIATTVFAARWLTRRATARIDALIAAAARVHSRDLAARLPVGAAGDELDEMASVLNQMLARIETGVAGQRQFAADASHELRTPIAIARMKLEVARLRARSVREWELTADEALAQLERMSTLIDALIQLARADTAGKTRESFELGDVVDRVQRATSARASLRSIQIAVKTRGAPPRVVGDPAGLEIALGNLVANAIAHSPDGAGVVIETTTAGDEARVDVIDHGPGVPADDRERIFEPFARGQAVAADRVVAGAGVGLGLAIARRIATAHGGVIEVDAAPGGGARFSLVLPVDRAPVPIAAATAAATADAGAEPTEPEPGAGPTPPPANATAAARARG